MSHNNLREIRMREFMMEPQEFAKHIGVNYKTYYSWEKGTAGPSLDKALEIAKILNKSVEDIWYLE